MYHLVVTIGVLIRLFIVVTAQARVNVIPECGNQQISVQLVFDGRQQQRGVFTDWIIVGTSNRPECRLRGNGELQYMIEIAVFNDPCGTQMVSPGILQNTIRIGQNPWVILQGDETVTVRCVYGLPEVDANHFPPTINPSFNIEPHGPPAFAVGGFFIGGTTSRTTLSSSATGANRMRPAHVYVIIAVLVLLALLAIVIAALIYFMRRRQRVRIERRKRLLVAVPPTSELGKLGHLWWSGKTAMIGNDALLNHDYMLSSNSTRDDDAGGAGTALSVSTTTSDTAGGGDASTNTTNSSSMSPPPPVSPPDPINTTTTTVVQQPRSYSEWRQRMLDRSGVASQSELGADLATTSGGGADSVYARISGNNNRRSTQTSSLDLDRDDDGNGGTLGGVRSITEIYQSAETRPADNESVSTLEGCGGDGGNNYMPNTLVASADVHAEAIRDRQWIDAMSHCVDRHRGFGPRKLTEQEIGRWRQMVANDVILQKCIARARTLEQLIEISQKPEYRSMFSTEKWNLIAQCVIDDATVNNGSGTAASSRVTMAGNDRHRLMMTESPSSSSGGSIHRFAKKDDAPRRALVVATATAKKKAVVTTDRSRSQSPKSTTARPLNVYVGDVHMPSRQQLRGVNIPSR